MVGWPFLTADMASGGLDNLSWLHPRSLSNREPANRTEEGCMYRNESPWLGQVYDKKRCWARLRGCDDRLTQGGGSEARIIWALGGDRPDASDWSGAPLSRMLGSLFFALMATEWCHGSGTIPQITSSRGW